MCSKNRTKNIKYYLLNYSTIKMKNNILKFVESHGNKLLIKNNINNNVIHNLARFNYNLSVFFCWFRVRCFSILAHVVFFFCTIAHTSGARQSQTCVSGKHSKYERKFKRFHPPSNGLLLLTQSDEFLV
jgi:hypothetical protein